MVQTACIQYGFKLIQNVVLISSTTSIEGTETGPASSTRTETNTVSQAAQNAFEQNSGGNTTYYATAGGAAAAGLAAAAGVFYFRKGKTATAEVAKQGSHLIHTPS